MAGRPLFAGGGERGAVGRAEVTGRGADPPCSQARVQAVGEGRAPHPLTREGGRRRCRRPPGCVLHTPNSARRLRASGVVDRRGGAVASRLVVAGQTSPVTASGRRYRETRRVTGGIRQPARGGTRQPARGVALASRPAALATDTPLWGCRGGGGGGEVMARATGGVEVWWSPHTTTRECNPPPLTGGGGGG